MSIVIRDISILVSPTLEFQSKNVSIGNKIHVNLETNKKYQFGVYISTNASVKNVCETIKSKLGVKTNDLWGFVTVDHIKKSISVNIGLSDKCLDNILKALSAFPHSSREIKLDLFFPNYTSDESMRRLYLIAAPPSVLVR